MKNNLSIIEKLVKNVKVAALKLVLEFIELHIMKNKLVIFTIFVKIGLYCLISAFCTVIRKYT